MAITNYIGFETGDNTEVPTSFISGTVSYSTSTVYDGTYSLRVNPTTTGTGFYGMSTILLDGSIGAFGISVAGFSFYFRYATKPSANSEEIFSAYSFVGAQTYSIRINSSGNLLAYKNGTTLLATGSTALSADTWYRISGYYTTGAGTSTYGVSINGASEVSGTGETLSNFTVLSLGKRANRNGETVDFFYDNFILDDTSEITTNYKIALAKPIANGSTMQWTSGTGSSNYAEVDEVPRSDADYVKSTGAAGDVALFGFQTMSTIGVSGYGISAVKANVYYREDTSVTSATRVRIRSGSTNSDSNARNLIVTEQPASRLLLTNPDTSSAWTESAVNALEAGVLEDNAVAMRLTGVYITLLLSSSATTTSTSSTSSSTSSSSTSSSTSTSTSMSTSTSTSSTSTSLSTSTSSTSVSTSTSFSTSTSTSMSTSSTSSYTSSTSTSTSSTTTLVPDETIPTMKQPGNHLYIMRTRRDEPVIK